jgi:hypothetical protein
LTNSNIAVARAAICDAAVGKARTLSLSYMGSLYALSRAVATSFSGFTVGAVDIAGNPYLFPCLLGGGFIFIVIIATCLVFPETQSKEQRLANKNASDKGLFAGLQYIISHPVLLKLFTLHCVHSFGNGSMLIGMTMYFSLPINMLGLSFTTRDLGVVFGVFGFAGFLFQITLFRKILERYGAHGTYSRGLLVSMVSTFAVPLTGVSSKPCRSSTQTYLEVMKLLFSLTPLLFAYLVDLQGLWIDEYDFACDDLGLRDHRGRILWYFVHDGPICSWIHGSQRRRPIYVRCKIISAAD